MIVYCWLVDNTQALVLFTVDEDAIKLGTGNDVIVTLGKFNAAVGDAGQDIIVAGGKFNFVYGDSLTQGWTLDSIQLPSLDDLLPDIDFSALYGVALEKVEIIKDLHIKTCFY